MKKKNIIVIVAGIVLTTIVLMYSSYALFSTNQISKSVVTIKVGTINPTVKVDGTVANKLTVAAGATKEFTVTLENLNNVKGKFLFYYQGTLAEGVTFGYLKGTGIDTPPGTSGVVLDKNGKKTYSLKVKNTTTSSQTITLGSLGGLETPALALPSGGHIIEEYKGKNCTEATFVDQIICLANDISVTSYEDGEKTDPYTFQQSPGTQQSAWTTEELIDYRYIGDNPNNYVYFNCTDTTDVSTCEKWRVIGAFTTEQGQKQKVKLMRNESIGAYSYDYNGTGTEMSDYGSNEWQTARVRTMLNGIYYNRKSGTCYSYVSNSTNAIISCSFTANGLTESAREMIAKTRYYLGGISSIGSSQLYIQEHSSNVYGDHNTYRSDTIGLPYPSDYVYSYLNTSTNGWMHPILRARDSTSNGYISWFMSPGVKEEHDVTDVVFDRSDSERLGSINMDGYAFHSRAIVPVLYLDSTITYVSGTGSETDPFVIAKAQ